MKTLIIAIQMLGGVSLLLWVGVFSYSLLPLGYCTSYRKNVNYLKAIVVFLYPLLLGFSYWRVDLNLLIDNYSYAISWSICPLIMFLLILILVKGYVIQFIEKL